MRSLLIPATLLVAALLLFPAAQAGTFVEADGKWYWSVRGTVGLQGLPGLEAHARLFVADDGAFWWRVAFDPFDQVYLQCDDGAGVLSVAGLAQPTESCSLEFNGGFAIPRAVVHTVDLGAPPGQAAGYVGALVENLSGSGAFPLA